MDNSDDAWLKANPGWVDKTPQLHGYDNLTVGVLRAALADLPDDATVESGYYTCHGVGWNATRNLINIWNSE